MIIDTKNFGKIEIDDNRIYTFECGIPGFFDLKKFAVITDEEEDGKSSPFSWLQSIEDKDISFIIMDVFNILPDYNPLVADDELDDLGEITDDSLAIYNIVVIPSVVSKMTVNLKAPVVINLNTNKGKQIITKNDDYPIKYYFYEEMKKKINNGGK